MATGAGPQGSIVRPITIHGGTEPQQPSHSGNEPKRPRTHEKIQWVIIELFAGLMSLSLAFASMNIPVMASFFSETCPDAMACIAHHFPEAKDPGGVCEISAAEIIELVKRFPGARFCLGGGPPCQDVSELNATAAGAQGARSVLREEFEHIYNILRDAIEADKKGSAAERLLGILECTRMRPEDRPSYDKVFKVSPFELCSRHFTPATRPRWW